MGFFRYAQNYRNLYPKAFDFCENLKMHEKNIWKSANLLLLFYTVLTDSATLKNINRGWAGEAPWKPSINKNCVKVRQKLVYT